MAYSVGRGLTAEERSDIADAFHLCADVPEGADRGGARALSRHGLSCAMMSLLGYKPATFEAKTLFRQHARPVPENAEETGTDRTPVDEADTTAHTGVSMPAFEVIMAQKYRFQDVDERHRQSFRQFDHGKGYITIEDALSGFREAAPCIPEQTVRDIFYEADTDGHGKISYRDFRNILDGDVQSCSSWTAAAGSHT